VVLWNSGRGRAPQLAICFTGNKFFAVFASLYGCVLVMTSAARRLEAIAGTRGTDSRLDGTDIDKNFGTDLPVLFKIHEIWSVDSQENY